MQSAPFFDDIAEGPEGGRAVWATTGDGLRIRVGLWPVTHAQGTVLLFPGRSEYIEKYGRTARDLADEGFATLAVDWRGQGLSDRLTPDAMTGHVGRFTDYQADMRAMLAAAETMQAPRPWHLLAHSMGGAIGLRAVMEGLPVASCAFSAPMWGIRIRPSLRPVAWSLSWGMPRLGMGHLYAPGSTKDSYILTEPFETNKLTRDAEMYRYMADQCRAQRAFCLGGPSFGWLNGALRECRALARRPAPDLPCLTIAGTAEEIVDLDRIRSRMAGWPGGELWMIDGARHEVLMETPDVRAQIRRRLCRFFRAAASAPMPRGARGVAQHAG